MHSITIHIPPEWKGGRWIESEGIMKVDLDALAIRCGNREYVYHPYTDRPTTELQVTAEVFRKVCNLIVKYAKDKDFELADQIFTTAENPNVRKIWNNAKAKFETKRNRTDPD